MTKNWAVYRNGLLLVTTLTKTKAERISAEWAQKGFSMEVRRVQP